MSVASAYARPNISVKADWPNTALFILNHGRPAAYINVGPPMSNSLRDSEFDEMVSLRDAYRIMEAFVESYLSRGDGPVSDFLHAYVGSSPEGLAMDLAAPNDFLAAASSVKRSFV